MIALLDALRDAGGALSSTAAFEQLRARSQVPQSDLTTIQRSGETRFAKEVRFARLELVRAGLINLGAPGHWSLSDAGWGAFLTMSDARALIRQRRHGGDIPPIAITVPGPTTGPKPVSYEAIIVRSLGVESFTYMLRFGDADLWKIGHTQNVAARLAEVNRHIPIEVIGHAWKLFARRAFANSLAAYEAEQKLLGELADCRTQGERVQGSRERVIHAWQRCFADD